MSRLSPAKHGRATALIALFAFALPVPAHAAGEILITQAKANAGNVTPGDNPGFPVSLTQPGSYQLAGNLTVPAGKNGVVIAAHDVTVDLNGFRIYGSNVATNGIVGSMNSSTVRNGTVALFKLNGIHLSGDFAVVENMRAVVSGSYGIAVTGRSSLIQENVVSSNFDGIFASNSLVQGNVVSQNARYGIRALRSTVLGNTISSNGSYGIFGDNASDGQQNITGYGNNTLVNNNGNGAEVFLSVVPLHPNAL